MRQLFTPAVIISLPVLFFFARQNIVKTIASLFSGGGGVEVGAIAADFKPIWGIENDPQIASVYTVNVGHQPLIRSVSEVNPFQLERPDVLWASPPCQAYSYARSNSLPPREDGDIGLAIIPFLEILQPQAFILENVEGYRLAKSFYAIVDTLHRLGYCPQWSVLNAADFGVPQTRRRLILRAVRGSFVPPLPALEKWRGWHEALADLIPALPESQFAPWQLARLPELLQTSLVESRNTIRSGTVRISNSPSPCVLATSLDRPVTTPKAFIVDSQSNGTHSLDGIRRLTVRQAGKPVFTITATADRKPARAWLDLGRVVAMTPRAIARFQSFPDNYQLPESRTLACRVIGNAVSPLMAQKLLETFR